MRFRIELKKLNSTGNCEDEFTFYAGQWADGIELFDLVTRAVRGYYRATMYDDSEDAIIRESSLTRD